MITYVPDRAAYLADHYYDDECAEPCGLCENAHYCGFCCVRTCYYTYECSDCDLYGYCEDPHKIREDRD